MTVFTKREFLPRRTGGTFAETLLLIFSFEISTLKNVGISIFFNIYVDINSETSSGCMRNSSAEIVRELRIDRPYIKIITPDGLCYFVVTT